MTTPLYNYDETADTLYISFAPGEEATGIELNEHILLRVDTVGRRAIGLTLFDYSILKKPTEYGPRSVPLDGLAELSSDLHDLVLHLLLSEPVSGFLSLSAYMPSPDQSVPITSLHPIPMLAA